MADLVRLQRGLCGEWQLPPRADGPLLVVTNPPWGRRLEGGHGDGADDGDLVDAWRQLAWFLRQQCAGGAAWVLAGEPRALHHLGMRSRRKRELRVGGVRATLASYEVYGGGER